MNKRFDSFREFLSCNEIVFKTVTATFLSVMAVIVSVAQFINARDQKALSELQTRIAEAQSLPQFEVVIHQQRNEATGKFDDNYLVVINNGGPVHEFTAEPAFYLAVNAVMNRTPQKLLEAGVHGI